MAILYKKNKIPLLREEEERVDLTGEIINQRAEYPRPVQTEVSGIEADRKPHINIKKLPVMGTLYIYFAGTC
jgi:hypothetical protein